MSKALTIGIDASRSVRPNKTGTEWYSYYLVQALAKIDKTNKYRLYTTKKPLTPFFDNDNFQWVELGEKRFWTHTALAREIKQTPPDVLFVPSHLLPLGTKVPTVFTVHDLAYKYFPQAYPLQDRIYLEIGTKNSAKVATRIITPSHQTQKDLIQFYKVPEGKTEVVYHGVDVDYWSKKVPSDSAPNKPYFLTIGRIENRKNTLTAVKAFAQVASTRKDAYLYLVGSNAHGSQKVVEYLANIDSNIRQRIVSVGYGDRDRLRLMLQNCQAFLYPSLYEGFGMPILEAFASHAPVISSNASSMPEVALDGAQLLDPTDTTAWAKAIEQAVSHKSAHTDMVKRGFEIAKEFSWETSAEKTLKVIKDAVTA